MMSAGTYRVVVIGGGAAGFMAAIAAKTHRPDAAVVLCERTDKWLAKVRISGGGRCNATHDQGDPVKLSRNYPRGEQFLRKVFKTWGQADTVGWFAKQGLQLKVEKDGRMFPVSDDSASVIEVLWEAATATGVELRERCGVQAIRPNEGRWHLATTADEVIADRVVVATGGSPKIDGLAWLTELGHAIVPPVPSLFTFNLPDEPVRELMGVVAPEARVRIEGTGLESSGPLLITHWGFSGPAVLRLSAFGARVLHEKGYRYTVQVNWPGPKGASRIRERLTQQVNEHPKRHMGNIEGVELPQRLWHYLLQRAGIPLVKPVGELGRKGMERLLDVLTNDRYTASGKTTFKEEFVTAGGVALEQVDPLTMESRVAPGLYFAGEVLDIDGITGGFNFQAAWSTGWIAGRAAAGVTEG
jgi:predicted Rossmann fold flavoprotein